MPTMSFLITSRELFDESKFPIAATRIADRPLVQTDFHRHEFFEILFVARGTLRNKLATEEMSLEPGDLLITKPYVQHLLENWSVKPDATAYSCSFLPQAVDSNILGIEDVEVSNSPNRYFFESFLSLADDDVSAMHITIPARLIQTIEDIFIRLVNASIHQSNASSARAKCDFLALLATLSDCYEENHETTEESPKAIKIAASRHRNGLRKALAYVHSHISEPITLEEAAEMSGVSVSYFSALIKQYTGVSFINYLTSLRMDHACSLLRGSSESIMDICFQVGYNDYSNFSKRFKKVTGLTPRDFRKKSQTTRID